VPTSIEKHQLSALDERERGFSRLAEIEPADGGCRAVLRYESTVVMSSECAGASEALSALVAKLHAMGYRQVRTRLNFRGTTYLGSQEPWIEHPDPEGSDREHSQPPAEQLARRTGWIGRTLQALSRKWHAA
jgi:hypothetical protein